MGKDILLINTPNQFYDTVSMGNELNTDKTYSVGLAYVSSALKRGGFDVGFIDGNFYRLPVENIVERVAEEKPDAVGMNVTLPNLSVVLDIAGKIKSASNSYHPLIIAGGPGATLIHEKMIQDPSIDVIVRNEGELTSAEVMRSQKQRTGLAGIKGITYRKDGKIIVNPRSEPIQDLDKLALPDLAVIPQEIKDLGIVSMFTTRGCSNRCTYCSTPDIWDSRIKFRSVEGIIEEIENYRRSFSLKEIHFLDDTFTVSRKRLQSFLKAYMDSGLHNSIGWRCLSRVNTVDRDILMQMKDAGCNHISYGIESANKEILKRIRKNITPEQAKEACEMTSGIGINTKAFFMIGFPWETEEEIRETLDYAAKLNVDRIAINIVKAYPGTPLYDEVNSMFGREYSTGFTSNSSAAAGDRGGMKGDALQQCLKKYAAIPERSCNPHFTTQQLLGFAEQGYRRFLENRG